MRSGMSEQRQLFPSLFAPGQIGRLGLKNRLIMAAMGNALADNRGGVTEAMLAYYRARARGGVGLVITQFAAVSPGDAMPYNLSLQDDSFTPGIARLIDVIHQHGARVCVQLMHPGMLFLLFKSLPAEQKIKVPSITARLPQGREYRELNVADIENIRQDFVNAAQRAKDSGADALELHACHGCLLSTFLSPAVNSRHDLYGGSAENRARFVREVIAGIKGEVGSDFPLIVRFNADDDVPGGVSPGEVARYAQIFAGAGADAISLSSGLEYWTTLMAPSYLTRQGVIIPVSEKIKEAVNLPVIAAGKITPALAEKTIASGKVDFVALGRPLLADPELPNKLQQGNLEDISQCLYCNNCLRISWRSCTVNPFLYRESLAAPTASDHPKKVMVIGGGLAGMQAALLCKMRGHDVSLYEKESALGGQWKIACAFPGKASYASIISHFKRALRKYQIKVTLGTEITREEVAAVKPEIVILATGASPASIPIPGISALNVIQANDLIRGEASAGGKIVVLGGTILAMEMAIFLTEKGQEVLLASPGALGGRKGPDDLITFRGLMRKLVQLRVPFYVNAATVEAHERSLIVRLGEEMVALPCDTLVLAAGVQAADKLAADLKGIVPEIYSIGDCVVPGNAAQAVFSAARLALKL